MRQANQKLKLLYLVKILREETDEAHPMDAADLIEALERYDIKAERKSIYDDIARLQDFGLDIITLKSARGVKGGYYLGSREFETAELRTLVDVVSASRFITHRKSRELIGKLEQLASRYESVGLKRQVYVTGRVKSENENIFYIVDELHRAIAENVQIGFQYLEWDLNRKLVPRRGGREYVVSPWALAWKDENYYLIAYDSDAKAIRHYRVDKMGGVVFKDTSREGQSEFTRFDVGEYSNRTFGMFGGDPQVVSLKFANRLVGVVIDRFGSDIRIYAQNEETFRTRVTVVASGQFYGWLAGLGDGVVIEGPEEVAADYRAYLENILAVYKQTPPQE